MDQLKLLSDEYQLEATPVDLLHQLVGADDLAGQLGEGALVAGLEQYLSRAIEEWPVLFMGRKQPTNHFPQARVADASLG
jgi:hypothetical protein